MLVLILLLLVSIILMNNFKNIDYFSNKNNIEYIFWTGGYDSTFMLCKFLIIDKKIVQPIYINSDLDNCKKCNYKRNNKLNEKKARNNILDLIKKKFPKFKNNIRPIIVVNKIKKDKNITNRVKKLKTFHRKYHQYEAMARYSIFNKKYVSIGFVGILGENGTDKPNDSMSKYLRNNLKKIDNNFKIIDKKNPFYYIKFPIAYISKKQMLNVAKKYNFDDILKLSWSCWFPIKSKPCGKCPMCRERIIKHPKHIKY